MTDFSALNTDRQLTRGWSAVASRRSALRTLVFPTRCAVLRVKGAERKLKAAVRSLWAHGLYPSPTALNLAVHDHASRHLGGCLPRWRREAMAELGIPLQRRGSLRAGRKGGDEPGR